MHIIILSLMLCVSCAAASPRPERLTGSGPMLSGPTSVRPPAPALQVDAPNLPDEVCTLGRDSDYRSTVTWGGHTVRLPRALPGDGVRPEQISARDYQDRVAFPTDRPGVLLVGEAANWRIEHGPTLHGRLYRVTCGEAPTVAMVLHDAAVDFGHGALTDDGHAIVFGGWDGLKKLDLASLTLSPLTNANKAQAIARDPCGKRHADVYPRVPRAPKTGGIVFERGANCGRDTLFSATTLVLDPDRGERVRHDVPALIEAPDGALLLGDASHVTEHLRDHGGKGALYRSEDGTSFTALDLGSPGREPVGGAARLAVEGVAPRRVFMVDQLDDTTTSGGNLWVSDDSGKTWRWALRTVQTDHQRGAPPVGTGFRDLVSLPDGRVAVGFRRRQTAPLTWLALSPGAGANIPATTRPYQRLADAPTRSETRPELAAELDVEGVHGTLVHARSGATYAWTTDGLFRRAPEATGWERVFPR